ncbi:MAG: 50S ribosomal protein L5 [Candidatus Magasanikbacteria bacterium]
MPTLHEQYNKVMVPALMKELGYKSMMQVPKIKKVVVNVGYGRSIKESGFVDNVTKTLTKITGQKPVHTKSKKAISNFKIREGLEIGAMVSLRGPRMWHFLEKLLKITFPRVRDFHGISPKSFDRQGNYTIGFKENLAFPEVKVEEIDKIHGLEIVINTSAKDRSEGLALLTALGFPFAKK